MLDGQDAPGATPLTDDDLEGLIPTDVATRRDLDQAEAENVFEGRAWAFDRAWSAESLLRTEALRTIHRQMFRDVWRWAGDFRRRDMNIGVSWQSIPTDLRNLLDDVAAWAAYDSYPADELVVRFHHRLVVLHPFRNGNGRHARLCADLLVRALGRPPFTWGGAELIDKSAARDAYLSALRRMDADRDDVAALLAFARA